MFSYYDLDNLLPIYYCDDKRHLVCYPYSIDNLHIMANKLNIKRYWFHKGKLPHYDIPKKRIEEITAKCRVVSSKDIVRIIKNDYKPFKEAMQFLFGAKI